MERSISWTSARRSFIAAFAVVQESAAQEHLSSALRVRRSTRDRKSSHAARSYGGLTKCPIEDPQVSLADSARETHALSDDEEAVVVVDDHDCLLVIRQRMRLSGRIGERDLGIFNR